MRSWRTSIGRWTLAAALVVLAGCGRGGTGEVTGKVTYKGDVLPGGMVTFIAENGKAESARIAEDGSYKVANIPVGRARITVTTQPPVKLGAKEPFEPLGKYIEIPPRYRDADISGLSLSVKRGSQQYDLPLTE
jgi:hypothetical protein